MAIWIEGQESRGAVPGARNLDGARVRDDLKHMPRDITRLSQKVDSLYRLVHHAVLRGKRNHSPQRSA